MGALGALAVTGLMAALEAGTGSWTGSAHRALSVWKPTPGQAWRSVVLISREHTGQSRDDSQRKAR
jgi:hypothetical protein